MKKKIAVAVAIVGLGLAALAPSMASADEGVDFCSIQCGTFNCWVAQLFTC